MNDIDLYTKYSITNKYWNLSKQTNVHYVGIGALIRGLYAIQKLGSNVGLPPYGNSKLLPFDVEFECAKLDDKIRNYYYRTIIPKCLFTYYDYKYLDIYNTDPWLRAFPIYMTGAYSNRYVDAYASIDALKNNSSCVYSYVLFYKDKLIRSNSRSNLMSGSVPLAIMHVTTLEGEPIVCVDVIKDI
jgi:hypothetical protein